jgi:hypothetical protein
MYFDLGIKNAVKYSTGVQRVVFRCGCEWEGIWSDNDLLRDVRPAAIDKAAEEPRAYSDVAAVRRRSDDRADVAAIEEAMQDPRPSVPWETVKAEIEKEESPDGA